MSHLPAVERSSARKARKPTTASLKSPPDIITGDDCIQWIQKHCYVPEGKWVGRPVALEPWQKIEIRRIYDNAVPTRRAILSFGRKNGKTALAAFLLLFHLAGYPATY